MTNAIARRAVKRGAGRPLAHRPKLFVVSAPSGSGKTTLCERLLASVPSIERSVSVTTRTPRRGEVNGRDYHFVSRQEFQRRRQRGEFLEWARVFGEQYGTLRRAVERDLRSGRDVLLSIDVQGAAQVRRRFHDSVLIFILPPSTTALRRRLVARGLDTLEAIQRRLSVARHEIGQIALFDYVIVNDQLDAALDQFRSIVVAERARITSGPRRIR